MNESCHKNPRVIPHVSMSHVTRIKESCHMYQHVMSHERVVSQESTSHSTCINDSINKSLHVRGELMCVYVCWGGRYLAGP